MPTILHSLTPADLSFPERFSLYRPAQKELVDFVLYGPSGGLVPSLAPRRFMCCGAPPGVGKSLAAHTIGQLSGMKYVVLTATKALEDQQARDFVDGSQTVNVRGRANYPCVDWQAGQAECNCEEGGNERDCPRSGKPGCTYFDRVQEARRARGIVTNYAYWIAARMANNRALEMPGAKIGMLICDEAHLAADALARALSVWVSNDELHKWSKESRELIRRAKGEEWGRVNGSWVDALEHCALGARAKAADLEMEYGSVEKALKDDVYRRMTKLAAGLDRVCLHGRDNNWIWRLTKNGISFDCIWPGKYAERYLWSGVEKVVLMSASLVPKAMHILRIPSSDYYFKEWPRQFPAKLSPVWWVPTGRMGHGAKQSELDKCVAVGDRIFETWGAYKGLVHSQSYKRAEWLQSMCKWGRHMYINDRGEATQNLERFLKAAPPAALVSPSYTTGTDLTDDACRWIWIPKMPFADKSDPIMLARMDDDAEYYQYDTMQTLVQACGRGARHERDWCVSLITDDHIGNFRNYARRFAPRWWRCEKWEGEGVPSCTIATR